MFSSFMLNSWIAGSLVAITAGFVGYFVVLRGASFAAHALPLGTFPGAAAAAWAGINPFYGLISFALLGVAGISWLGQRQRHDVATALTLITLLGLGTLFLSLSSDYANSVYALLFGEILGISNQDIAVTAAVTLGVTATVLVMFRPLLLSAISPDLAAAAHAAPRKIELLFLTLLALATALALPVAGALLVFSLLVGPAAAARAVTAHPVAALFFSAGFALLTIWAAIALSYVTNWPVGFFVGTLAAAWYGVGRIYARRK